MQADAEDDTLAACRDLIRSLEARLQESEDTLDAIRHGDIDALVINQAAEHRVYTLDNADRPYRVLIEQIQEGAVTLGADGTIYYCNQRLAHMLGVAHERVAGQLLQPFLRAEDADAFAALLATAQHGPARGEFTLRTPTGEERPVYVSLSPLQRDDQGLLLCGVLTDQTQQRQHLSELSRANAQLRAESAHREAAEEALRQAQKMEAVGQMTGGLAHDFNNLLTGIAGSLELMQTRIAQGRTAELGRYLTAAMASASRAAALTHRLLAFSRRQTLDPKVVHPNSLVAGMEELLRQTVGPAIAVEVDLAAGAGTIVCDPHQLENALLNLAINARDAMPDGGRLTIAAAPVDIAPAMAAARDMPPGSYIAIAVTDAGTGMPPEVVARAFDPFFTTKPLGQGTGLGLSMIYGFAKQSGGQVRIHSQLGLGTTVTLYLPRHEADVPEQPSPPPPSAPPLRAGMGETVLVVDDEPVLRMLVLDVLEELGYAALEAGDANEGLRQLDQARRVDLLVTDVGLPGGMNGRQLADAARTRRPGLKVLFVTGFAENAVLGAGGLEPGMAVMTKPFALDALAARIKQMIDAPSHVVPDPERRTHGVQLTPKSATCAD